MSPENTTSGMPPKRIEYVDAARGAAIMLVVLGHSIQYADTNFDQNLAFRVIYAVHMPLFMFLAGFVTRLPTSLERRSLATKAKQLLLPFLAWIPILYIAMRLFPMPGEATADPVTTLLTQLRHPDAGALWFLIVLFECHLLLRLLSAAGATTLRRLAIAAAIALLVMNAAVIRVPSVNWLGLNLLRWYFLFFVAGVMAKEARLQPVSAGKAAALSVAFLVLAVGWTRKSAIPVDLWLNAWPSVPRQFAVQAYHALAAFVGIAAALGLAAELCNRGGAAATRIRAALLTLGNRSLQIYAGHYVFLDATLFATAGFVGSLTGRVAVVFAVALGGALLLARLVDSVPRLRTVLYGR